MATKPKAKTVPIDAVKPYPGNPRRGELDLLKTSLQAHGQYRPLLVQASTGRILAGNNAWRAMKDLAFEKISIWEYDVDDEEAKKIVLLDNRTSDLAEYDFPALADLLGSIDDLALTGYDEGDLDQLLREIDGEDAPPAPEPIARPKRPKTKTGDVYELGSHVLVCGDATDAEVVRSSRVDGASACITDPPYGIDFEYDLHDDDAGENLDLVQAVFANAPQARIWTPGKMNLARDLEWNPDARLICWYKRFAASGNGMGGASTWEPILVVGKPPAQKLKNDHLDIPTDREEVLVDDYGLRHPCPKPVALYEALVKAFTRVRGGVYEPFAGSGTTLIACENTGRRCHAIEIDPGYCDVIVDRWQRHTGLSANRA